MPKTLIGLSAVQNSALSNQPSQAHEKIKPKLFLNCPSRQRGGKVPAMCGRVSINEAENKLLEEKITDIHTTHWWVFFHYLKGFFFFKPKKVK